jgi:hypothetical protein
MIKFVKLFRLFVNIILITQYMLFYLILFKDELRHSHFITHSFDNEQIV